MTHRPSAARRGFTLVELLLAMVLTIIVGLALFAAAQASTRAGAVAELVVYVTQEARRGMDTMASDLREAGGTIDDSIPGQLEFQLPVGFDTCTSNAICWGAVDSGQAPQAGWKVRYQLVGGQLLRKVLNGAIEDAAAERVLANDVSAATFDYDGAKMVAVTLRVGRASNQIPGGQPVQTAPLVLRVELRNS